MFVEWARQRGRYLVANWRQLKAGIQVASLPFSACKQAKVREGGRQDRGGFHAFRLGSRGHCLSDQTELLGAPLWRLLSKKCSTWGIWVRSFQEKPLGIQGQGCWTEGAKGVLKNRRMCLLEGGGAGWKTDLHRALRLCQALFLYVYSPCVYMGSMCVITHVILTAAHKMGTVIAPFYR